MFGSQREYKEGSTYSIPTISFKKSQLQEIMECFPEGDPQEKLLRRLADMENLVQQIQKNQSLREITDAVNKIENHAKDIFAENKRYDQTLANTLQRLILAFIQPVKEMVEIENKKNDPTDFVELQEHKLTAEELEFRKRKLYAEQSFMTRQQPMHQILIKHLCKIKKLLIDDNKKFSPRCYMVCASPTEDNQSQEYWVMPFASVLYEHLKTAGINVLMSAKDVKVGDRFDRFIQQYVDGNDLVFLGTKSMRDYYVKEDLEFSIEKSVLNILVQKQDKSGMYPLLISGTPKTAFPEVFGYGSNVANAFEGYIETLKKLADFLLREYIGNRVRYENIWKQLKENIQKLPENNEAVTKEINVDYHRSREIEYVHSDISRLSPEIEKEIQLEEAQAQILSSFSPVFVKSNSPKKQKLTPSEQSSQVNFEIDEAKVGGPGGPNASDKKVVVPSHVNLPEEDLEGPDLEDLAVGPEIADAREGAAVGHNGANFNLLAGLVKKPSEPKFQLSPKYAPPVDDDEDEDEDENEYSSGSRKSCVIF